MRKSEPSSSQTKGTMAQQACGGGNRKGRMRKAEFGSGKVEVGKWNVEFRAKIGIVKQEADESLYWLELLMESGIATSAFRLPNRLWEGLSNGKRSVVCF